MQSITKLSVKKMSNFRKRRIICKAEKVANSKAMEVPSYWEFAERVNGRAAMQGFMWGSVNEAITGNNVLEQLITKSADNSYDIVSGDVLNAVLVLGGVVLGTAITTFAPNKELQDSSIKLAEPFTADAEMLNGRLAMIGFVILALFT